MRRVDTCAGFIEKREVGVRNQSCFRFFVINLFCGKFYQHIYVDVEILHIIFVLLLLLLLVLLFYKFELLL